MLVPTLLHQVVQNFDFDLGALVVALDCSNYLDGIVLQILGVLALQGSAEGSIAEVTNDLIVFHHVAGFVLHMASIVFSVVSV
jgi:hypothetical protein